MSRGNGWTVAAGVAAALLGTGVVRAARAEALAADRAQDSPNTGAGHLDPDTSRLIADAVAEYDAGRFEEARALFRSAHTRAPNARTLRGIGMASFELRDYVEATRSLDGALHEKRRPLTDEQRRQVETLLARAETFVGRYTPRIEPPGATLLVDGQASRIESDGSVLLPFGRHRLTARCARCTPTEKAVDLDVAGGERGTVDLALAVSVQAAPDVGVGAGSSADALASLAGGAPGRSPTVLTERRPTASSAGRKSAAAWLVGGAALALIGAGIGALWWHDRQHELDACQDALAAGERCTTESTISTQRNAAIGVTLGLGAAALTLGTIAAVLWPKREVEQAQAVACSAGIGSMSCEIQF